MTSRSNLEREITLLTWHLRANRMTSQEHAIFTAGLVGKKPIHTLESRVVDLTEELRKW